MKIIFDRNKITFSPLSERINKLDVKRDMIDPRNYTPLLD